MKHLICINLRGNIQQSSVEHIITQSGYELLGYGKPVDDGIDGFYYSIRTPVVVDIYKNTKCVNILISNDGAQGNDRLLYNAIIHERQLPELMELIHKYEYEPYCHVVRDYKLQPSYTNCCESCVNLNCQHRHCSSHYDNMPSVVKKSFVEYKDILKRSINNYIYSTYRDMDMIIFLGKKFENFDYILQLFIKNYYNNKAGMSRFLCKHTDLLDEYDNSRIISLTEIVNKVFAKNYK